MYPPTYLDLNLAPVPAELVSSCQNPRCRSEEVFTFDGDVFCQLCGWDSIEARVDAQVAAHSRRVKSKKLKAASDRASEDGQVPELTRANLSHLLVIDEDEVA